MVHQLLFCVRAPTDGKLAYQRRFLHFVRRVLAGLCERGIAVHCATDADQALSGLYVGINSDDDKFAIRGVLYAAYEEIYALPNAQGPRGLQWHRVQTLAAWGGAFLCEAECCKPLQVSDVFLDSNFGEALEKWHRYSYCVEDVSDATRYERVVLWEQLHGIIRARRGIAHGADTVLTWFLARFSGKDDCEVPRAILPASRRTSTPSNDENVPRVSFEGALLVAELVVRDIVAPILGRSTWLWKNNRSARRTSWRLFSGNMIGCFTGDVKANTGTINRGARIVITRLLEKSVHALRAEMKTSPWRCWDDRNGCIEPLCFGYRARSWTVFSKVFIDNFPHHMSEFSDHMLDAVQTLYASSRDALVHYGALAAAIVNPMTTMIGEWMDGVVSLSHVSDALKATNTAAITRRDILTREVKTPVFQMDVQQWGEVLVVRARLGKLIRICEKELLCARVVLSVLLEMSRRGRKEWHCVDGGVEISLPQCLCGPSSLSGVDTISLLEHKSCDVLSVRQGTSEERWKGIAYWVRLNVDEKEIGKIAWLPWLFMETKNSK